MDMNKFHLSFPDSCIYQNVFIFSTIAITIEEIWKNQY